MAGPLVHPLPALLTVHRTSHRDRRDRLANVECSGFHAEPCFQYGVCHAGTIGHTERFRSMRTVRKGRLSKVHRQDAMSWVAAVLNAVNFRYLSTNPANRPWTKTCVHPSLFVDTR